MSIQKMREDIGILAKQLAYIEAIRLAENQPGGYPGDKRARAAAILKDYLVNFEKVAEIADRRGAK
jgi:hypothetical protein